MFDQIEAVEWFVINGWIKEYTDMDDLKDNTLSFILNYSCFLLCLTKRFGRCDGEVDVAKCNHVTCRLQRVASPCNLTNPTRTGRKIVCVKEWYQHAILFHYYIANK